MFLITILFVYIIQYENTVHHRLSDFRLTEVGIFLYFKIHTFYGGKKLERKQCCQEACFLFCIFTLLRNSYCIMLLYIALPCGGRWVPYGRCFSYPAKCLSG